MAFVQAGPMAEPLRPQFFVTRQNGTMVPLIATDELPSTLSIRGVPRTLTPHDISGMTGVGTINTRHRQYVVDGLNKGFQSTPPSIDRSLMGSSFAMSDSHPVRNEVLFAANCDRASIFPCPPKAYGIQEQPPSSPKAPFANMPASSPEPAIQSAAEVKLPDLPPFHNVDELPVGRAPGIKEYCSYWLRHGECDYAQQGCLYRHEMPINRDVLEKLGLRDIPRWYREKHQLGSFLAGGNNTSGIPASSSSPLTKPGLMERNWRHHPAEVLLEGTARKPNVAGEAELPTSASSPSEKRSIKPSLIHVSLPKPAATKPHYDAIVSRHQPLPKAKHITIPVDSVSEQQKRETIRQLNAHEQRERELQRSLNEKYQVLTPTVQKNGITVPVNTPSTSTASSTSGVDTDDAAAVRKALEVSEAKVREAAKAARAAATIPTALLPKPVAGGQEVVGRRRGVGSRRKGGKREQLKENGEVMEGRERTRVDRLVDHERLTG